MAVVGGYILIVIVLILIWMGLMSKFEKVGKKVTDKVEKTFGENKEETNND